MTIGEEDMDRFEKYVDMEEIKDEKEFWDWFGKVFKSEKKGYVTRRQKQYIGKPLIQRKLDKDDDNWYIFKTKFNRYRDMRTGKFTKSPNN